MNDVIYTLEYKEYDDRDMYYILENGKKLVCYGSSAYTALYIDRNRMSFYIVELGEAQKPIEVLELIVSMRKELGFSEGYKANVRYLNSNDNYYTWKLYNMLNNKYNSSKECD